MRAAPKLALALLVAGIAPSRADVARGPVNQMLQGCVDGRSLRIIGTVEGCAPAGAPTLGSCGTGAALSTYATDFVGRITIGSGLPTSCTLLLSKLYTSPAMGCLTQTNSAAAMALAPIVGTSNGVTSVQIPVTAALSAGVTITYVCFPV